MAWLKWLKRPALTVTALLALWAAWLVTERGWMRRQGNRSLAAAVAEVDASDPDWRWEKLNAVRNRPPADQNATDLIPRIKKLIAEDWGKAWIENETDRPPNVRYPARIIEQARKDLTASADGVKLARSLKGMPNGHREIVLAANPFGTKLDDTMSTRQVADLLRWDAVIATEAEDFARVADNLAATLNASRSVGDEPFLISQLVRMGTRTASVRVLERALAQAAKAKQIDTLWLAEFQTALASDAEAPLLLFGLRGERVTIDMTFDLIDSGALDMVDAPIGRLTGGKKEFRLGEWLYGGRIPGDRAFTLRWLTAAVQAARKPIHEQPAAFAALPLLPHDKRHVLSRLFLRSFPRCCVQYWKSVAEVRCAVVAIACERYRLARGHWPAKLGDLPAELLSAVPLDPFSGEPIRHRALEDGVVIYSVGPAATKQPSDDLEKIEHDFFQKADAPRPNLPAGVPLGFRLWNPDQRRLPPPAEPVEPKDDEP